MNRSGVGIPAAQLRSLEQVVVHAKLTAHDRWRTIDTEKAPTQALVPPATFGDGEITRGSSTWFEIRYGKESRFIHESLLTSSSNDQQYRYWGGIGVATMGFLFILAVFSRAPSVERLVNRRIRSVETVLPVVVVAVGIAVGAIGYLYSRFQGTPVTDFVSDALVNIGAGLIGSAATFILFQSLFSGRVLDRSNFDDRVTELTAEIRNLQQGLAAMQERIDREPSSADRRRQNSGRPKLSERLNSLRKWLFP